MGVSTAQLGVNWDLPSKVRSVTGTPVVGVPVGEPFVGAVSNGFYNDKKWRYVNLPRNLAR